MRLSELGKVLCTRYTSFPRMLCSYETTNSPSENLVITKFPNGQPKLAQIFSARYLVFVPEKTKKELFSLISTRCLYILYLRFLYSYLIELLVEVF